jgi:hypothetical protein
MRFAYRSPRGITFTIPAGSWKEADQRVAEIPFAGSALKLGAVHESIAPTVIAANPASRAAFRKVRDAAWTLRRRGEG